MKVLDPNSTGSQIKVASLKVIDAMISDSRSKQEENDFKMYREYIELLPTSEIDKELKEGIPQFTEDYLNKDKTPNLDLPTSDDQSQLPTPQLNTPNLDANLLARTPTQPSGINATGLTVTEQGLLSPEEQAIRLRQRGMA
jgi:hypothetical protein